MKSIARSTHVSCAIGYLTTRMVSFLCLTALFCSAGCGGSGNSGTGPPPPQLGPTYYVDCSASANGNGSQSSPWNTLSSANAVSFAPGDQLLFKRGTTCQGALNPAGSGSSSAPIVIDAYGTGAQPAIDGGMNDSVIALKDQQYWEIRNLEIVGGDRFGIFIWGNTPNSALNHFHLVSLNVHGAHFTSTGNRDSGEVYISPGGVHQVVNDVLIDGVSAHDSHVAEGIIVSAGGDFNGAVAACQQQPTPAQELGNNITIQNSTAHDVYMDGILITAVNKGLMQNNVVYDSGLCPGPNASCGSTGLWEWCCHDCTIQNNESYANHTASCCDGGDFDIDLYNNNNVLQYNYGHDSDGYCVILIGNPTAPSTNNIFRYNICSNDGRNGVILPQGEVQIGSLDPNANSVVGVQVYNNSFFWNPAVNSALFLTHANAGADSKAFENNIIYSSIPQMIQTGPGYTLDHNIYWTTSTSSPIWQWNGVTYNSMGAYQSASGQDPHSLYTDPMLNNPTYHAAGRSSSAFTLQTGSPARGSGGNVCLGVSGCSMGTQDFFGNSLPTTGTGYDIGANQAP